MIKILLADDHSIIRSALRTIIETNIPGSVVDETLNADLVLEKIQEKDYDLLILDINMPGINSVELIKKIFLFKADMRLLIFSMNSPVPFETLYLQLGAKGYIPKTSSYDEIIQAIQTVLTGNIYSTHFKQKPVTKFSPANPFDLLSPREFEILQYLLHGKSAKEIYEQSRLASSTISTYKARIQAKLGIKNIMELISLARTYNIIID